MTFLVSPLSESGSADREKRFCFNNCVSSRATREPWNFYEHLDSHRNQANMTRLQLTVHDPWGRL